MNTFATVEDVLSRWPEMVEKPRSVIQERLLDATAWLSMKLRDAGVSADRSDDAQTRCLELVTCNLVKRCFARGGYGASTTSEAADGISLSTTWANPEEQMYLTKAERKLLGIGALNVSSCCTWLGGVR